MFGILIISVMELKGWLLGAYLLKRGLSRTMAGVYDTAVKPGRVAYINSSEARLFTFADVLRRPRP